MAASRKNIFMGVLHELRKSAPGTRGCRQFFSNTQWLNAKLNSFVLDPYHFYQVTFSSRVGKWTLSCWKRRIICNTFSCRTIPTKFSLHFSLKRKKWKYALDASRHSTTDQIWVPLLVPRFYSNFSLNWLSSASFPHFWLYFTNLPSSKRIHE